MVPGDLCKHLLHNYLILINLSKFSHVLQISWREALHLRKLPQEICAPDLLHPPAAAWEQVRRRQDPGAGAASGGRK